MVGANPQCCTMIQAVHTEFKYSVQHIIHFPYPVFPLGYTGNLWPHFFKAIYKEIHSLNAVTEPAKSESRGKEAAFNHGLGLQMFSCAEEYRYAKNMFF